MADEPDDHNETFDNVTAEKSITDPSGREHTGELAAIDDLGEGGGTDTRVNIVDADGNLLIANAQAIHAGDFVEFETTDNDSVILRAENTDTDTHVTLEAVDGEALLKNPDALHAGDGLELVDDGDNTATLNATATGGSLGGPTVVASGSVDLSGAGDSATALTGVADTAAPLAIVYGADDQAEISHATGYDPNAGEQYVYFECHNTGASFTAPVTVSYNVLSYAEGAEGDAADYEVVASDTTSVDGAGDFSWVTTNGAAQGDLLSVNYGVDDDAAVGYRVNYDPNFGEARVRFGVESVGDNYTGPATIDYDILNWGAGSGNDDGGSGGSGSDDGDLTSTLYEDFETTDYEFWTSVYRDGNISRTQNASVSGDSAMEVVIQGGSQYGATTTYEPVAAGDASSYYDEMFVRYYVYFPTGFSFENQRSKLPGPWSTKGDPTAGNPSDGTNGWSARGSYGAGSSSGTVRLGYYTYYMDMSGSYGNYFGFDQDYAMGEWHRIDQHVKKNTISNGSANYDGEMHMWVNGTQIVDENSMRFSTDTSTGIDFRMAFFFGGDNPAPSDQSIYTDDYRVDNTDFAGML